MPKVIFVGILGFIVWVSSIYATFLISAQGTSNDNDAAQKIQSILLHAGEVTGSLISPAIQLGLILSVLIYAARAIGFGSLDTAARLRDSNYSFNVQAIIAIIVIGSFSISAISGLGQTSDLKEITLVVVGFYFGTRRKQADSEADAATAGAVAGAAAATAMGSATVTPSVSEAGAQNP